MPVLVKKYVRGKFRPTTVFGGFGVNMVVHGRVCWTLSAHSMKTICDLLASLKQTKEEGSSLHDRTMVFLSSNLGDGSVHSVKNLPVLLAGGGFRHGQHLRFDPQNPPPLCNLYVSMLQRLGIDADKFSTSTGTLKGLEPVG